MILNTKVWGCVTLTGIGVVAIGVVWILLNVFFLHRVDAGNVGILVNYNLTDSSGKPTTTIVMPGSYQFLNPFGGQVIFQYPVQQESLVMASNSQEGEVQGNDSVPCQDKNGVQVNLDVTAMWNVIPKDAGTLFFLRPNQPLVGNFNNDIESTVVRPVVRNSIGVACSSYSWDSIGANKDSISTTAKGLITQTLEQDGIGVSSILIGDIGYSNQQEAAISSKATAQQQAEQAQYLQQKAQYEAAAAIASAKGQAEAIKILDAALASNPNYIQYLAVQKWNGQLPTYFSGSQLPFISRAS